MEWEVSLIEWIQNSLGSSCKTLGSIFSFIGGETGLPILVNLISMIFSMKEKSIVAGVLGLAALILSLVVYFIYLGYLSKAKRMLEG